MLVIFQSRLHVRHSLPVLLPLVLDFRPKPPLHLGPLDYDQIALVVERHLAILRQHVVQPVLCLFSSSTNIVLALEDLQLQVQVLLLHLLFQVTLLDFLL